jgi:hypothetical protein
MENYEVTADGPSAFAVRITYHSGRREIKRGFQTKVEAETWAEAERAKALQANRIRKPDPPDSR